MRGLRSYTGGINYAGNATAASLAQTLQAALASPLLPDAGES
jgi:hypothetical protein